MTKCKVGLCAFLIGAGIGALATYDWATRTRAGEIETIRTQSDSIAEVERAKQTAAWERVDLLEDSLARVEQESVQTEIAEAGGAVEVSGSNLQQHLELREDTAGLRLWGEHERADAHLAELWQEERNIWMRQIEMRVQLEAQLRNIIASQDTHIVALEGNLRAMQSQAERWRLKAEPPFLIRLFKGGFECGGAGAAAWGLSKDPMVGLGTAGACLVVKQIMP